MFKYICLIFCSLCCLSANAGPVSPYSVATTEDPIELPPCNLSAPLNLYLVASSTHSLSFAWAQVVNTNGYNAVLVKVSNNQPVYSDHIWSESVTIDYLEAGVLYEFRVSSVCAQSGAQGGTSTLRASTDYVIVDDLAAGLQGNPGPIVPNTYVVAGISENFAAQRESNGDYTIFRILKETSGSVTKIHIQNENDGSILKIGENWDNIPIGQNSTPPILLAKIYYNGEQAPALSLKGKIVNGQIELTWADIHSQGASAYTIRKIVPGAAGPGNNNRQSTNSGNIAMHQFDKGRSVDSTPIAPVQITPNPFSDAITITRNSADIAPAQVRIFDLNGREILKQAFENEIVTMTIPTADLPTGMYVVRYETADSVQTIKLFKSN